MKKTAVVLSILALLLLCSCGAKQTSTQNLSLTSAPVATAVPTNLETPEPEVIPAEPLPCQVIIDKQPTDEHLTEGSSAIFIAKATGADSVRWVITDPTQVHSYDAKALSAAFPAVELEGETTETLKIRNVPAGMDGFRVSAVFADANGEVQTGLATIHSTGFFTQIPKYYIFSSGVGAWRTVLKINDDGTFEGKFSDSDMGNNALSVCEFKGVFGNVRKIDGYSSSIDLLDLEYETPGTETYDAYGTKVKAADPYGLEDSDVFTVYLPHVAVKDLPEGFIPWLHLEGGAEEFDGYGIYNSNAETGFVSCTETEYVNAR